VRARVGATLLRVDRIGSTNDLLRALSAGGALEGTVVVAREQTAGRGRLGRVWASPPGGLWLSVLLRPDDPTDPRLGLVVAVGVAEGARRASGVSVVLKWPNDLMLNGRKVGGILVESLPPWAVVGIGLNVDVDPARLPARVRPYAGSLAAGGGRAAVERTLAAVVQHVDEVYAAYRCGAAGAVLSRWRDLCVTLGRPVVVRAGARTIEGVAETVDAQGALLVRRSDGSVTRLLGGDVTVLSEQRGR